MRIHHLNCATLCPPSLFLDNMVCHCLLIETDRGLVLVDTGIGSQAMAHPEAYLSKTFLRVVRPRLNVQETAAAQLALLGYSARDVRHVVMTHLDLDHAGGLADFPDAEVHVAASELAAAEAPQTRLERERYRPKQWEHGPRWKSHGAGGDAWNGFAGVRALDGLPPEILLVPLLGHTRGHHGVAVDTGAGWVLHAGDAYFHYGEVEPRRRCPVALRAFQSIVEMDRKARFANQALVRALANDPTAGVRVFCAHDATELGRCRAAR